MSTRLTISARGRVTFRREVLAHPGIGPGDKLEIDLLPNGQGIVRAARPNASAGAFVGLLAGRTPKVATLEEIDEAISNGWAGSNAAGG